MPCNRFSLDQRTVASGLIALALLVTVTKIALDSRYAALEQLIPGNAHDLTITVPLPLSGEPQQLEKLFPAGNGRQQTSSPRQSVAELPSAPNHSEPLTDTVLQYQLYVQNRPVHYRLARDLPLDAARRAPYLTPSEHVNSSHESVKQLAAELAEKTTSLNELLTAYYQYVSDLPPSRTPLPADAALTLRLGKAAPGAKAFLFTALCRAGNIPARLVMGLDLSGAPGPREPVYWSEVRIQNNWVPFDPERGYFAFLPEHMLVIGPESPTYASLPSTQGVLYATASQTMLVGSPHPLRLSLWSANARRQLPSGLFRTLLLFPICGLIVAILRNVVGLKTFGIFLPALLAIALTELDLLSGLAAFVLVVVLISSLHFPLSRWNLLHTPKLVIMLSVMTASLFLLYRLGGYFQEPRLEAIATMPVVVLTLTAERFARQTTQSSFREALVILLHTLLATALCYAACKSNLMITLLMTFPEWYLAVIGCALHLGGWMGLRLAEYWRFLPMLGEMRAANNHAR